MVVGLAIGGLWFGGRDRRVAGWRREGIDEQGIACETGIPLAALGIQDPQGRSTTRWAVAVVRHERLGALADDVPTQPDPRPSRQLEPDAGGLVDRGRQPPAEPGRIQDQQQGLRATGQGSHPVESIGDLRRRVRLRQATTGQVQYEQIHGSARDQTAGDAQALIEIGRGDDHEPLETDTTADRLDRVEAARQVEPGDDGTLRLGLGGDAQGEGRPAARSVAADGHAGRGWHRAPQTRCG
jgi:hypothetical protein